MERFFCFYKKYIFIYKYTVPYTVLDKEKKLHITITIVVRTQKFY
jgi:hypothetical protein